MEISKVELSAAAASASTGSNTRVLFPTRLREMEGGRAWIRSERAKLGPLNRGERATLAVFAFAVFFWIFRPALSGLTLAGVAPFAKFSDAGIAVMAAMALFLIPVDRAKGGVVVAPELSVATDGC